ncbi:maleylacetoacetate isomerase-like isoform X3 [Portunus trituberculatus]|uniref:maleylacetoacetate isomerase-like isoform X3 n=1 Tax=Portunus trituberculatus TaxID=210409 RepID=UPI001E1CC54C|nr:maleylacetoacetate isomerase-like isoform X3 [Portunus trituberculatus]
MASLSRFVWCDLIPTQRSRREKDGQSEFSTFVNRKKAQSSSGARSRIIIPCGRPSPKNQAVVTGLFNNINNNTHCPVGSCQHGQSTTPLTLTPTPAMTTPKPILYSYFRSSCSWRVRIVLAHKKIDYEYQPIHLLKKEQVSDEYTKVNPMGQVPALIVEDKMLTQSISIMEYLEETYPQNPLLPKEPLLRAKVREICEVIGSGIQPLQNLAVLQKIGDEKMEWGHFYINKGFCALEQLLAGCAGKYSVGDQVTLADCCLVPQVYNANSK